MVDMKFVYTVVEREGAQGGKDEKKSFWIRIGVAFVNRDGSMNVKLDALPVNGTLQIRDREADSDRRDDRGDSRDDRGRSDDRRDRR